MPFKSISREETILLHVIFCDVCAYHCEHEADHDAIMHILEVPYLSSGWTQKSPDVSQKYIFSKNSF